MTTLAHILVIGFHHKKGSIVECLYPELEFGTELPSEWSHIPSIALPDGAHNFDKVPSLTCKSESLFGVACYRQIDTKDYSSRTSESTRNSIQKSVVLLARVPLFGYILTHLESLTDQFVTAATIDVGFASLQTGFHNIDSSLRSLLLNPPLYKTSLLCGLSAVNFLRTYQRDVLILLKLLLLERKILFTSDVAVNYLSTWLLTLVSLLPESFAGGLQLCAVVDDTWVGERSCWPLAVHSSLSASKRCANDEDCTSNLLVEEEILDETKSPRPKTAQGNKSANIGFWSNLTKAASTISTRVQGAIFDQNPQGKSNGGDEIGSHNSKNEGNDPFTCLSPLDGGGVFDSILPTDDWGLPLALFSRSYLLLPYVPLNAVDLLLQRVGMGRDEAGLVNGSRVRGFLAGTTNPLLSQNAQLAEVIVKTLSFNAGLETEKQHIAPSDQIIADCMSNEEDTSDQSSIRSDIAMGNGQQSVSNKSNGVFSKLMYRPQSTIRLSTTQPNDLSRRYRSTPIPLSRVAQLSRMDRVFVDHLVHTVELWHSARRHRLIRQTDLGVRVASEASELDEEQVGDSCTNLADYSEIPEGIDQVLPPMSSGKTRVMGQQLISEALAHSYSIVLAKFPTLSDLELWIRAQFSVYVKSLLLSTDGQGAPTSDFNANYVTCLYATHSFLVWRDQFVIQRLSDDLEGTGVGSQLVSEVGLDVGSICSVDSMLTSSVPAISGDVLRVNESVVSAVAYPELTYHIPSVWLHPGKSCPSNEVPEQIVQNLKQFGNIAAGHGRRVMSQCVNGLLKLSSDEGIPGNSNFAETIRTGLGRLAGNLQNVLNSQSDSTAT